MSEEQYWEGPPRLVKTYRKLYELQLEKKNQEAWWQGYYFYKALDTIAFNLTRKQTQPSSSYPKEPLRIKPYTKAEEEERSNKERQKAFAFFQSQQNAWRHQNGR